MKELIFVSNGRCGTKRISEILRLLLQEKNIEVSHQRPFSRLSNVLGNLMYYTGSIDILKKTLIHLQVKKGVNGTVFCDPLTAMCLPKSMIDNSNVYLVHIFRDDIGFAQSMLRLTRKRWASWFAHNLIPLWQPSLWPLENWLNLEIIKKYEKVNRLKNTYFEHRYSANPHYQKVTMEICFKEGFINDLIKEVFDIDINVNQNILNIKSNQSN